MKHASVSMLRSEICAWINDQEFTHALTLNTDRELSANRISGIFSTFCHRIDKAVLGRNAQSILSENRFRATAFPENLQTNAHLHVAADLTEMHALCDYQTDSLEETLRRMWLRSTRGAGSIDVQEIRGAGWSSYMSKGFTRLDAPYFLSSQYHPS